MARTVSLLERRVRQKLVRNIAPPFLRAVRRGVFLAETRMRRSLPIDRYCRGTGIEIGAAASPAIVPVGCTVRYVDKYDLAITAADPEIGPLDPVRPDILCGAEKLEAVESESQDFVLAFSLLEHVQDPLGALEAFTRVSKPGAVIIVSVPDKRNYGPDTQRPLTTFEHLVRDHQEGPEWSREEHFRESGRLAFNLSGDALEAFVKQNMDQDSHVHFHVWEPESFLEFVMRARTLLSLPVEILEFAQYGHEVLCVLRKKPKAS